VTNFPFSTHLHNNPLLLLPQLAIKHFELMWALLTEIIIQQMSLIHHLMCNAKREKRNTGKNA
jgi:hypothetical protein